MQKKVAIKTTVKWAVCLGLACLNVYATTTQIMAPVSIGELIDKITILEIKSTTITDSKKLEHIQFELSTLENILEHHLPPSNKLNELKTELASTNKKLWDIEDAIREKEVNKEFDQAFIDIARSVYFTNDLRAKIKRTINLLTESDIIEEKQYTEYQ